MLFQHPARYQSLTVLDGKQKNKLGNAADPDSPGIDLE
jgi:hypothetical protein